MERSQQRSQSVVSVVELKSEEPSSEGYDGQRGFCFGVGQDWRPPPAEAVARYKGLADIERGFRVLKSDIEIAPVHHRLPERIRAHALICFLALVLYRVMRMRLKARGHSASPRTALDMLARIQRHSTKIGERSIDGLSTTTPEQLELFNTLNLPKPA